MFENNCRQWEKLVSPNTQDRKLIYWNSLKLGSFFVLVKISIQKPFMFPFNIQIQTGRVKTPLLFQIDNNQKKKKSEIIKENILAFTNTNDIYEYKLTYFCDFVFINKNYIPKLMSGMCICSWEKWVCSYW